jgi:trans-aconitate 2-methyltransferase
MTEWNAPEYARLSALQAAMGEEALALLELKGNERILDIGCGNGKITREIAARVPQGSVLGVDASADMIAFAASHLDGAPNLEFLVADVRHLPFQHEFDLVVSFNALHWIPEQGQALDSIRSAMKSTDLGQSGVAQSGVAQSGVAQSGVAQSGVAQSGVAQSGVAQSGVAQLRLVPRGERKSLENVLEETRLSPRWIRYFENFHDPYLHLTPEQYEAVAEEHGLHVRRMHTEAKVWDFQSRSAFLAFSSVTMVEWTQHLPEAERTAFITDVLDHYQRVAADAPGEEHLFRFYQMDITLSPR